MIDPAAEAESTVQGEAVSIGPAVEADSVIWTARLRTGRVVTFLASVSKDFRAAALIALVAAVDLVAGDLAGSADSAAADFAAAAAGSEVGDEN
jgi:hypothetical protein